MTEQRFSATLERSEGSGGHWLVVPIDARAVWGEARPPVAGTVNGVAFRSRLSVYGGRTLLGLNNEIRTAAGIAAGDTVDVVLGRDDAARQVEVPGALQAALDDDTVARAAYDGLSFTHRREYARWIAEAKREETRARRAARAIEMLRAGVRTPD